MYSELDHQGSVCLFLALFLSPRSGYYTVRITNAIPVNGLQRGT